MAEYLGELGRLVRLRCASTERAGRAARYRERTTVEGLRRVQVIPAQARTWDVDWALADQSEVAALSQFVTGAWGSGPWHWVSVEASRWNLLTPDEADLVSHSVSGVTDVGPMLDVDGVWRARSVGTTLTSGYAIVVAGIPVLPGVKVTWSADVVGSVAVAPQIAMSFLDASGQVVSGGYKSGLAMAGVQRVSQTLTPPAGAVSVAVGIAPSVLKMTRPQVSWTDGPVPFSVGHGCRAAVIEWAGSDLVAAWDRKSGALSSTGFTVLEVM